MDPMGVLANEYVRRLSAEQFAQRPRDRREAGRDTAAEHRRAPRMRRIGRGFRRLAEAVLD